MNREERAARRAYLIRAIEHEEARKLEVQATHDETARLWAMRDLKRRLNFLEYQMAELRKMTSSS